MPSFPPWSSGRGVDDPSFRLFDFGDNPPGVGLLTPNLTINGVTKTPDYRYYGGDAGAANCPANGYGETLTLQAGTAPTLNDGSPGHGTNDDSVLMSGDNEYAASGNAFAEITTEDIVFESVFKFTSTAGQRLLQKYSGGGYLLDRTASAFRVAINDGTLVSIVSVNLIPGAWYHVIAFLDRSGSGQIYINGAASGAAVDITAASSTLAIATPLKLGGANTVNWDSNIAYAAMWKHSAWLDTHLQAAIAAERFARLSGVYPQKARGTYLPTVATRASAAYLDKIESGVSKLYLVGPEWMRVCSRLDSNGDLIYGYLAETKDENEFLYSEDFTNAAWSKIACAVDSTTLPSTPFQNKFAHGIVADAGNTAHGLEQTIGGDTEDVFSVYLKAGNKDWALLTAQAAPNEYTYFNLATGVLGTQGAGVTAAHIQPLGDGWYRCSIVYPGAAAHIHAIAPADADTDAVFAGDASTVNTWVFGAHHSDEGLSYPTSYIQTTSATVTRVKDQLRYKGDDGNVKNNGVLSIFANVLLPDYTIPLQLNAYGLNDGGANADRVNVRIDSSGRLDLRTRASGGDDGDSVGTTDLADNIIRRIGTKFSADNLRAIVNGAVEGTPDTAADVPNDLDRIDIGQTNVADFQLNGLISQVKIFPNTRGK